MPSERVQRRIDSLLDQAEEAADARDWSTVAQSVRMVLRLDSENEDAIAFSEMLAGEIEDLEAPPESNGSAESSKPTDASPTSFANGRYEVKRLLGEGGKKKVYLAHDTTLDRDVAFGLIKAEGLDVEGRQRITREAQAMGRLGDHPNIMPIHDLGDENGQPYMVQPLMAGGDVETLIEDAEDGKLPLEDALRIASEILSGLEFAHDKGIIHRDLKPGNVWLTNDGTARIGDFGLAISLDRSRLTQENMMVGTVSYMPPEQATGGETTPKADLYSLGAMLYEMTTGRPPFMGDDDIAIIGQHINTPPVAPGWHNQSLPQTLDSLIMRLLSKDPGERPNSASDVLSALEAIDITTLRPAQDGEIDGERAGSGGDAHAGSDSYAHGGSDDRPAAGAILSRSNGGTAVASGNLDAMASGVFVGRHREMDALKASFEETLGGHGKMAALVGEPGIGKTRTAQELATYANMRGGQALWGRCYEGGGAPPYWPWVQAIRSYVMARDAETIRNEMGSAASIISEIVPDVKERLPDVSAPSRMDDPESARFRLFDSIATFLKTASNSQPIVLMLEDLHWADKPSLTLLEFVARELSSARLMIVVNYRDMELNRRHPLSMTLGELTRERLFDRVLLRGLQKHDVHRFIEVAAGIDPPDSLVDVVHTQTEGNPLFVTETVRLLIQEGEISAGAKSAGGTSSWEIRIPEGVREVIGRRLDRLSERCNEVLTTTAVIGRQFRFNVLMNLADDASENMLLDALDEALSARIIEEDTMDVGLCQFTHALMQETLTAELSLTRRVRLHARIAETLEFVYKDAEAENSAELAHHFAAAEAVLGPDKLITYSVQAGEQALAKFAFEQARVEFARAIAAIGDTADQQHYGAAYFGLGRAQLATIEYVIGVQNLKNAFDWYLDAGMMEEALRAAEEPMPTMAAFGDATPALEMVRAGISIASESDRPEGRLLANLGNLEALQNGDYEKGADAFKAAMSIAERDNDLPLRMRLLTLSGLVSVYHAAFTDGGEVAIEDSEQAIALAREAGDLHTEVVATYGATLTRLVRLDTTASREEKIARQILPTAERMGDWLHLGRLLFVIDLACVAQGRWEAAAEAGERAIALAYPVAFLARISAARYLGNIEMAFRLRDQIKQWADSAPSGPTVEALSYAMTLIVCAELTDETSDLELAESSIREIREAENVTPAISNLGLMGHAFVAIHRNDVERYADLYRELLPLRGRWIWMMTMDRALGRLASRMGDRLTAETHFEEGIADARSAEHAPELAWTCSDYADMLIDRDNPGDSKKATQLHDKAITIATELGMKPLLERVLAQREMLKA